MKRLIITLLSVVAAACLQVSCGSSGDKAFDFGEVTDGVYTNNFFKFRIAPSDKWEFMSADKAIADAGTSDVEWSNGANAMKAKDVANAYLTGMTMLTEGSLLNTVFTVMAENISAYKGVKDGGQYLAMLVENGVLQGADGEYSEAVPVSVGGRKFYKISLAAPFEEFTVSQDVYATVTGDFALSIITTYTDMQEEAVNDLLGAVQFF
jgi:hypothetical protein